MGYKAFSSFDKNKNLPPNWREIYCILGINRCKRRSSSF
nr:MAG TPA: hypothetical protein [Caudoviricetes sp.]